MINMHHWIKIIDKESVYVEKYLLLFKVNICFIFSLLGDGIIDLTHLLRLQWQRSPKSLAFAFETNKLVIVLKQASRNCK